MDKKRERIGQNIRIKKYEDIFESSADNSADFTITSGSEENKNDVSAADNSTVYAATSSLREFRGHPFKVVGKGIDELLNSIREHGILSPIIVRPVKTASGDILGNLEKPEKYEIISGHRRRHCAVELGLAEVPVIVRDIDDDDAILLMVDSNIQRENILPSEKAFAYKMKLEAIKRQGARSDLSSGQVVRMLENELTSGQLVRMLDEDLSSGQVVRKLDSAEVIGKENNESGRQIRRYIRLTDLPATLLEAVDNKKMSFNAGVELSFLDEDEKSIVQNAISEMRKFPSLQQAKKIRELSTKKNAITKESVFDILVEQKSEISGEKDVNFDRADIRSFFPKEYTARQIEEAVIEILRERA